VTFAVIWRFVHDSPRRTTTPRPLAASLSREQCWLLASVAVWSVGAASEQFLLLRAAELGMPGPFIPLLWFGISLVKGVTANWAGPYADRTSPRLALAAGWLVFALGYAGLAAATSLVVALPLMLVVGAGYGVAEPAERTFVAVLAPAGRHGQAFGWYALVQGLMSLPAGLLAGALWDAEAAGPSGAFAASAGLAVAAVALLAIVPAPPPAAHGS